MEREWISLSLISSANLPPRRYIDSLIFTASPGSLSNRNNESVTMLRKHPCRVLCICIAFYWAVVNALETAC